jgi:hypothetical protein
VRFARYLVLCLALSCQGWASITATQHKCTGTTTTDACSTSTCTVSALSAVGAGHLLIAVLLEDGASIQTLSSINGETWTHCTSCTSTNSTHEVDASYVLSATGGETSFQMTLSGSAGWNFCIYEYATTTANFTLDGTPCKGTVSAAAPNACNATISGSSDVILSALVWSGSLTGVSAPFGDFVESDGNGTADHINTNSGTGASFTPTTSGTGPEFTIAFQEAAGGAAAAGFNKRRKLEKLGL